MIPGTPLRQHREILADVLGQLVRNPGSTLLTVLVLAAALALPAALMVVTDNLERLAGRFEAPGTLAVFLDRDGSAAPASLEQRLRDLDGVRSVTFIPPEEALAQASRLLEIGDALEGLETNPLPGSYEVTLAPDRRAPARMAALADTIGQWQGVDQVQYDRRWVERFQAGVAFLRRVALVTGALLAGVVVLIIGNTIRLAVANRQREIELVKMIGGTDSFVRLPFLYNGLLQGLLGAAGAGGLVVVALALLNDAVATLATRYGATFALRGPGPDYLLGLLAVGGALGWLGSRLAVGRHLREVEPG
jgi:cell division transport system permease protein